MTTKRALISKHKADLHMMSFDQKVDHWAKKYPWSHRTLKIGFTTKVSVSRAEVNMDAVGNITKMPLLIDRPCFGQVTAYLRHGGNQPRYVPKMQQYVPSRCMRCKVVSVCQIVAEKRIKSSQNLEQAVFEWQRLGGSGEFKRYKSDPELDRCLSPWRRAWGQVKQLIKTGGPFTSSNDVVAARHYEEEEKSYLAKDAERKRLERRQKLKRGDLDDVFIQRLKHERNTRAASLCIVIGRQQPLPPRLKNLDRKGARLTADAWYASTLLKAHKLKVGPSSVARKMIELQIANGQSYDTLRDRLVGTLQRVRYLETSKQSGSGDPYWLPFDFYADD